MSDKVIHIRARQRLRLSESARRPAQNSSSRREIKGLVAIAAIFQHTPDQIVDWWLHHQLPLTYRGARFVTTWTKIERWVKARMETEREARRRGA